MALGVEQNSELNSIAATTESINNSGRLSEKDAQRELTGKEAFTHTQVVLAHCEGFRIGAGGSAPYRVKAEGSGFMVCDAYGKHTAFSTEALSFESPAQADRIASSLNASARYAAVVSYLHQLRLPQSLMLH